MDLEFGPEYDAFRAEVRAFLDEAWPRSSRDAARAHAPDPDAQRRFIAAALDAVADPDTFGFASYYLVQAAAADVTDADIHALVGSDDPARCLLGLALRKQRGEPVDGERRAECEADLPRHLDDMTMVVRLLLAQD